MGRNLGRACAVASVFFLVLVWGFHCYLSGVIRGKQEVREESVESGKAKWNPKKDGTTVFEWMD